MKKIVKNINKKCVEGFTLLEMLMVLLIISILMLLFIPNLSKQKDKVTEAGNEAVVKIVENQAELYELSGDGKPNLETLRSKGQITDKQVKAYKDYYAQNSNEKPNLSY